MADPLPKYDNPPVVETVLSAQFERLSTLRIAHAGCFWQTFLGKDWKKIEETGRLDDTFERFGDERKWGMPGIRFFTSPEIRTQISNTDGTRMIQLQDSRFIYNWKKLGGIYPSFVNNKGEFSSYYRDFRKFTEDYELGKVEENQWEVSYINHLVKGELWNGPKDWRRIFPWLNFPPTINAEPDYLVCEWASIIEGNRGRLHTHLAYARVSMEGPEALILTLTARGGASAEGSVEDGFELGHDVIVRSFTEMTSDFAQSYWKRTQ